MAYVNPDDSLRDPNEPLKVELDPGVRTNPAPPTIPTTTHQLTDNRTGIADAYRQFLGRDPGAHEYDWWTGNTNYAKEIQNSPEAQARTSGQTYQRTYQGFEGVDQNKLNNPQHTTPKYQAARILSAGGSIQQAAQAVGGTVIDATRFRLPTGEIIDTRRDEEGANALQWLVMGGADGTGRDNSGLLAGNARFPGGAGGSGGSGSGNAGTSGQVFSDPATAQWEQLLRQLSQQMMQAQPTWSNSQMDLMQTQALDPLERQRQARKQQETQRLASRGITPGSGIFNEAMANIDRQFDQQRTTTQGQFATQAIGREDQLFANNEQRNLNAVNLFKQIPQYADTRMQLAQGTMMPANPYQTLALGNQINQQNTQNAQYQQQMNQQFYAQLASLITDYFNSNNNG